MNRRWQILMIVALLLSARARASETSVVDVYGPGAFSMTGEPNLSKLHLDKTTETYRFTWFRSFKKPTIVRMWKDHAGIRLRVIRFAGKQPFPDIGQIARDETFAVTAAQWDEFLRLLNASAFWAMPDVDCDVAVSDGSNWVLEGKVAGKYHIVDRCTPSVDLKRRKLEDFVACCWYLLKLSREEVTKKDMAD